VNLQHRAGVLARTELFGGIDEATQRRIAEHVAERVVERGQCVFVQDEPGDRMYVLAEGAVKLFVASRNGGIVELVRHRPPAAFGEVALLDGGPRSASAEAVERSTLLMVTRAELLHLLRAEDQVAEALLRTLGTIVRRTTRQVSDLAFLDLQGRIARQLLALAVEDEETAHTRAGLDGQRGQADGQPGAAVARVARLHPGRRSRLRDPRPGTVGAPGRAVKKRREAFPGCQLGDSAALGKAL
jgi:CRP/FNR family cyclic AMP-dependent transcriptional regulator